MNPKYVIHKGMAGLGNRLQALGRCIDLVLETGALLVLDWRDLAWQETFDSCWTLDGISNQNMTCELARATDWGRTWPEFWVPEYLADFKRHDCPLWEARPDVRAPLTTDAGESQAIAAGYDTIVVCRYAASHSSALFQRLGLSLPTQTLLTRIIKDIAGPWRAFHARYTDKKGRDPEKQLRALPHDGPPWVVCTDSYALRNLVYALGLRCYSVIPERKGRGGIHHATAALLTEQGMTRTELNLSAVVDLHLCVLASEFQHLPAASSYDALIKRLRYEHYM